MLRRPRSTVDPRPTDTAQDELKRAERLLAAGDATQALRAFERVADEFERRQYWTKAVSVLSRVAALSPSDCRVYIRLGIAYEKMGYRREAANAYGAASKRLQEIGDIQESLKCQRAAAELAQRPVS